MDMTQKTTFESVAKDKDAFFIRLYYDHLHLGSELMGDPPNYIDQTLDELGLEKVRDVCTYVRKTPDYTSFEVFRYEGAGLRRTALSLGITFFGTIRAAETIKLLKRGNSEIPYTELYPHAKGTFFVKTSDHHLHPLGGDNSVIDKSTGEILWPNTSIPCSPDDPKPLL